MNVCICPTEDRKDLRVHIQMTGEEYRTAVHDLDVDPRGIVESLSISTSVMKVEPSWVGTVLLLGRSPLAMTFDRERAAQLLQYYLEHHVPA